VDIGSGRANAIKILCNLLLVAIRQANIKLYLINIKGGQAYSAIPCEAEAKICIPKENAQAFNVLVCQCNEAVTAQYSSTDPDVKVTVEPAVWHASVINEEGTHLILASVNGIPTGPVTMRPDGSVETSNNIGIIDTEGAQCSISSHTRSFSMQALDELSDNISKIFTLTGAEVKTIMHLSSWQENLNHPWVQQVMGTFQKELGFTPTPVSMHFALEAGHLVEKFPGIHIASIGPRIMYPHSPNEKVSLTTADNIWQVVKEVVKG
jgi:dipeptidase D